MKNVYDLLVSFSEANRLVIDERKNSSRLFAEFTELLERILYLMNNLMIDVDEDHIDEIKNIDEVNKQPNFKINPMSLGTFFKINKMLVRNVSAPVQPD